MKYTLLTTLILVATVSVIISQLRAQSTQTKSPAQKTTKTVKASKTTPEGAIAGIEPCEQPPTDPDVIVSRLTGPKSWSDPSDLSNPGPHSNPPKPPVGPVDGIVHYSLGTTSCNIGTSPLDWYDYGTACPTKHPVIAQNIYRLDNGRFEQIGLSWLKHGFCALQEPNYCTTCVPFCGSCCHELGPGCSDPYYASLNGTPSYLGPRSGMNASLGKITLWDFPRPANNAAHYVNDNGQIHVKVEDIDPALNPNALYFTEGHYLAEDDATVSNDNNNASWKEVIPANSTGFPLSYSGLIAEEEQAIFAWQAVDPDVVIVHADVDGDGRFTLGYRVTNNCDGTWHYEYAIHNMNSHDSGRSFSVPVSNTLSITNIGFHDVDYHSGDGNVPGTNYDSTDWTVTQTKTQLTWSTDDFATDPNANALRWGTLYNFRFDANTPPIATDTTLGLYRSGGTKTISAAGPGPIPVPCPADISPEFVGDGQINVNDLLEQIGNWGNSGPGDISPPCGNGVVNVDDLLDLIGQWGPCP